MIYVGCVDSWRLRVSYVVVIRRNSPEARVLRADAHVQAKT